MATSSSHRSTMSMASSSLAPPANGINRERRMTSPSVPPPAPLNLPEPVSPDRRRPPSPLRNAYTVDLATGELVGEDGSVDGDDDADRRSWSQHSPSPSVQKLASDFAQRVGSLVGSIGSNSRANGLPTDAELEAEAEREREKSRREAESILRREHEQMKEEQRRVEEEVFAMVERERAAGLSTPPPRPGSASHSHSSSPTGSNKDGGWFAAVKSKLTPTKEPLTPAQQIVQETKAREKERKKEKGKEREKGDKEKDTAQEWPAAPNGRYSDPAYLALAAVSPIGLQTPARTPAALSPDSPSPSRSPGTPFKPASQNLSMTPSPMRSVNSVGADSPSRDGPPLYAQFSPSGALDVPGTLLAIARRFEKLERWTVSHVRALEERMGDVEKWLVEREKDAKGAGKSGTGEEGEHDEEGQDVLAMEEVREEIAELQGRMGELGREMAKLIAAPQNLASWPRRDVAAASTIPAASASTKVSATASSPTTITTTPRTLPLIPVSTPRVPTNAPSTYPTAHTSTVSLVQPRPREVSPPPPSTASSILSTGTSRTRLPYPTGDYTSPPGAYPTRQEALSPASSPPPASASASFVDGPASSTGAATETGRGAASGRRRPVSIAGLPASGAAFASSVGGLLKWHESCDRGDDAETAAGTQKDSLPVPQRSTVLRPKQTSPTPRKRYTVALGGPLRPPEDDDEELVLRGGLRPTSPFSGGDDVVVGECHSREETITNGSASGKHNPRSPGTPRARAQSSYGPPSSSGFLSTSPSPSPSLSSSPSPITPLRPRLRSRSSDRIGLGLNMNSSANGAGGVGGTGSLGGIGRFVDPLVIRKAEKEAVPRMPKTPVFGPGKKVPVGELVAFFDGDKR